MKKRFSGFLIAFTILTLAILPGVGSGSAAETEGVTWPVLEDPEFGAVYIGCTLEEFLQAGFCLGDSCDVELSNGFRLEDVPVYDGYYGRSGAPVIVLYPSYEHPAFTFCTVGDLWKTSDVSETDTVRVSLREPRKYRTVQEALYTIYSNDRADYDSDIAYANFRSLSGGKLREGMFWRGASPVDNRNGRARVADSLLRENGIGFILDLADTREKAEAYDTFAGSYAAGLAGEGKIQFLGLSTAFMSEAYGSALVSGLRAMMAQEAPVYIQCTEGKDRTGFVCLLLEALAGADYGEIVEDYMISYQNYYGLTAESDPARCDAILEVKLMDMFLYLTGEAEETDFSGWTFEKAAGDYLLRNGMTADELALLKRYLTE